MIVGPYRRPPALYRVAALTEDGLLRHEDGGLYHPDELPEDTRAFGQWDVVRPLIRSGLGEALCWRSEEVRWRRTTHPEEEDWRNRRTDVAVHRVPLHPRRRERPFLEGLTPWRDWLQRSGARAASSTVGSESMSLLKASLAGQEPVRFSAGSRPPTLWTRGARMQDGPGGPGQYRGALVQLDLPSAYSALLGSLQYGGLWQQLDVRGRSFDAWLQAGDELPMFVRAQVQVPRLEEGGPLLRSRRPSTYVELHELALRPGPFGDHPPHYPSDCYLAGTWTRAELLAAMRAGCAIEPQQAWVHRSSRRPFAGWWELVLAGRSELAGEPGELLVKMTGNALVGNFSREGGARMIRGGGRRARRIPSGFQPYPAHDLADYITGVIRARLYELIRWAGRRLLTAHTDGAWVVDDGTPFPAGWRVKHRAHRLDLLGPSCYRYWRGRWPSVIYAGRPAVEAEEAFSEDWAAWLAANGEEAT